MYTYGFRSATHMSYPERSWVQLAYLYLHDSLPETAGNTVNCSVFCIFQDILRLVKLHFSFPHYTGKFISMYWCIYKLKPCVLITLSSIHHIWRSIPSTCLPDKNSCDIGNKIDIMHLMHKPYTLTTSIQAGAYFIFSPHEHCFCNCCGVLQGWGRHGQLIIYQ